MKYILYFLTAIMLQFSIVSCDEKVEKENRKDDFEKNEKMFVSTMQKHLDAVSNHEGGTMGGHYWAYTKNYDGIWYKFNDKYVSLKNTEDVVTPNAYCLFYKKRV